MDEASEAVYGRFAADYRQRFGADADATAAMAYDASVLLAGLLRQAGDEPPRRLFPLTTTVAGASGSLEFDRNGNRLSALNLLVCRRGCFAPLAQPAARP